jgi:hypothetical protein
MSVVLLGRNRFEECNSILAHKGIPILTVRVDPLRLEIATPKDLPSGRSVRVDETDATPVEHVKVVATATTFAVFWDEDALALATLLEPGTVHLKLDLRPLGINIYDDPLGLHIGQNIFSGNHISHSAVAINLGD